MTLFDISLPRITLSAIEVQCHASLTVFPLNTRLENGQLKEVTGSDVKVVDTLTKMLKDIDRRTGQKLKICTSQGHILRYSKIRDEQPGFREPVRLKFASS